MGTFTSTNNEIVVRAKTYTANGHNVLIIPAPVTLNDLAYDFYKLGFAVGDLTESFVQTAATLQTISDMLRPHKSIIRKRKRREQWRKRR